MSELNESYILEDVAELVTKGKKKKFVTSFLLRSYLCRFAVP